MITRTKLLNLFAVFLVFHYVGLGFCDDGPIQCVEGERAALLKFKEGFNISANHLLSWTADDNCCTWRGVGCDNRTGRVVTLDLRGAITSDVLRGELGYSLAKLTFLRHLDLSYNDFLQIQIPDFIGSLRHLEYLNLSNAKFRGNIPENLGNLSRLQYLDLSGGNNSLRADSLDWLSHLSLLRVLDLSVVDLSNAKNWLNGINMLPSLVKLHLHSCQLSTLHSSLPYLNLTALQVVDLSYNQFNSEIPIWLFQLGHSLASLNLGRSQFTGGVPNDFGNMTSLTFLDLSENSLSGPIPTIWAHDQPNKLGHSTLRELYLSNNQFKGSLEMILSQLSGLIVLEVASNSLNGVITEVHLQNFSSLWMLDLSSNNIILKVSSNWIPPFQLDVIGLGQVNMGGTFPKWLQSQKNFSSILISQANISDTVPDWFWTTSPNVEYIDLSQNSLRGEVPGLSHMLALSMLDLSLNKFTGAIPKFPPKLRTLVLAGNTFSGPISSICGTMTVNSAPVWHLDLSRNNLSGPVPDCWQNGTSLNFINFAGNALSGTIPSSLGYLRHLKVLRLDGNNIHGELPSSLSSCTDLVVLDLSWNKFSGRIPRWIGENLINLVWFRLANNRFYGKLPMELCNLKLICFLDLSGNNLEGAIPNCIDNFLSLRGLEAERAFDYDPHTAYTSEQLHFFMAGVKKQGIGLLSRFIDLSSNSLSGPLPPEMTGLEELRFLNISNNRISGGISHDIGALRKLSALDLSNNELSCGIPHDISALTYLEILDLSNNELSGSIPTGLVDLTFLSYWNVSYNNLSGRIPTTCQFGTFDSSSYMGNINLCGFPLGKDCLRNESYEDQHCNAEAVREKQDTREEHTDWLDSPYYISIPLGFFAGFWGFWGSLFLSTSWRHAYFRFLESIMDWIYVTVAVGVARFQRKFQNQEIDQ